jgi:uncharacterized protein DUF6152
MGTKLVVVAAAALTLLTIGRPALAHHSANAEFDTTKHFNITGVLTKLEIVNPHSWWYLDVKNGDGSVTHWRLESVSPAGLIRQGLKVKTDLKLGETYTFTAAPSWKDPADGGKLAHMLSIFVDGKEYVLSEI